MSPLAPEERAQVAAAAGVAGEVVERVLAAALAHEVVLMLPHVPRAEAFAGWTTFALDGQAKAAHVIEEGAHRALCGTPRPAQAVTPDPRSRVCVGCCEHLRALARNPHAIAAYDRGAPVRPLGPGAVPVLRRPPRKSDDGGRSRRAPTQAAVPAVARAVADEPSARATPTPVSERVAPSLFD